MVKGTSFKFSNKKASFYNAITLKITWQNEIPHNETKALGTQNGYYFTNDERSFYGNRIVKDIMVYR